MNRVLSISEIVESKEIKQSTYEVFATAEADYDESSAHLVVELDSFLQKVDARSHTAVVRQDWLPRKETVTDSVSPPEAVAAAKEIFKAWVKKVRQSIPRLTAVGIAPLPP